MPILMRAVHPQCHVIPTLLTWGTVLGLRDAHTDVNNTAPVSRDTGTTDRVRVLGLRDAYITDRGTAVGLRDPDTTDRRAVSFTWF